MEERDTAASTNDSGAPAALTAAETVENAVENAVEIAAAVVTEREILPQKSLLLLLQKDQRNRL